MFTYSDANYNGQAVNHAYCADAEAIDNQEGGYEWGPKGLKPFDLPAPTAGGDVAAVKAGHVSISALRTGFIQPDAKIRGRSHST